MTNGPSEFQGWFSNLKHFAEIDKVTRFGHWEWDIENDQLFWPRQVYDILGLNYSEKASSREQASYASYLACVHPEDRQVVNTAMAAALKNRRIFDVTHRVFINEQSIRFIRTHAEIRCDENNKPIRMVGIVHDITELLLFMDEQSRLNTMVQASHEFIATFDAQGKILFANQALKNITQPMCFQDCLSPENGQRFDQEIMLEVERNGSWEGENELLYCRDGKQYTLPVAQHIVKHQVESLGMQYFSTFMHDLSKTREVERIRKEAQEKAEITAAEETSLGSLLTISLQPSSLKEYLQKVTIILVTSVPWLQLLPKVGIFLTQDGPNGTVLKLVENYQLNEELVELCDRIEYGQCLCGRAAQTQKLIYADRIDERHDVRYTGIQPHGHYCVPILQDGKVLGVLALYLPEHHQASRREIDFLKRIADIISMGISRRYDQMELVKEKEKAQTADKAKSEFIANISHELRTPIHGILGLAELLSETELVDEQQEYLSTMIKSGNCLLSMVNDVLDFSQAESGITQLHKTPLNLIHMGQMAVKDYSEEANAKNIPIHFSYPQNFPKQLMGDEKLIHKVLSNLVANAVKFTAQGEIKINLEVIREELQKVTIRYLVKDTGVGIDPAIQNCLFSRFSQGDGSITRLHGGIGLGLTICKKILELMGGKIDYCSTPNQGTTFWFELDLYLASVDGRSNLDSFEAKPGKKDSQGEFDRGHLEAMKNLLGNEFAEFVNAFFTVVSENLEEYPTAMKLHNNEKLLSIARNIKSAAENIGAGNLSKDADHMKELVKSGDFTHIEMIAKKLLLQFENCKQELEEFRGY